MQDDIRALRGWRKGTRFGVTQVWDFIKVDRNKERDYSERRWKYAFKSSVAWALNARIVAPFPPQAANFIGGPEVAGVCSTPTQQPSHQFDKLDRRRERNSFRRLKARQREPRSPRFSPAVYLRECCWILDSPPFLYFFLILFSFFYFFTIFYFTFFFPSFSILILKMTFFRFDSFLLWNQFLLFRRRLWPFVVSLFLLRVATIRLQFSIFFILV